ncbi:CapA family protein [Aureivirga sp. CE67]|uniref:CapA family protein n=1 Tax=Aureivirga sp. CE67 TaxID=1788983 RepID=UPI0018CA527B|nr:CapA family protein [Aureivirga sp. CE67]
MKRLLPFILFLSVILTNAQESSDRISLLFIGDFMGHMDQINAAYNKQTKTYDYTDCFKYIKETLSEPDLAIGNLEVTLGVTPYSGYPQFSSPASYASAIKESGVDVLMTANNHSCDKRKKGVERTISILDSLEIPHTGTFINNEVKKKTSPLIIEKNGFKIAIINFTYGTNGIPPTKPNVVNYLDQKTVKADIAKAKEANADQIIAFVHWGIQYKDMPSKNQKEWYDLFKREGINMVIGAHPHVLQPMVFDKESGNFVAYSLGNFVSHQRTFPRDGGAVLKIDLVKKDNKTVIDKAEYKLTWVYEPIENGQKQYYILPVSDFEEKPKFFKRKTDYDKMIRFTKHARTLLGENNKNVEEYK